MRNWPGRARGWAWAAAIGCCSVAALAQSEGVWDISGRPGAYCYAKTGFGADGDSSAYEGIRLFVTMDDPSSVIFVLGLNDRETQAVGTTRHITLHLTFSNPDHGNAFVVVPTSTSTDTSPPGASDLIGPLDPRALKFFRQYRRLDIFDVDNEKNHRVVSLANSSAALNQLSDCIGKMSKPR